MSYAAAAVAEPRSQTSQPQAQQPQTPLPQAVAGNRTPQQTVTMPEPVAETGAYRYRLRAVREPSVLSRVVEMFTLRDLIPNRLICHDCPEQAEEMLIDLVAGAMTAQQAENIAARMLNIVPVLTVLLESETA